MDACSIALKNVATEFEVSKPTSGELPPCTKLCLISDYPNQHENDQRDPGVIDTDCR